MRYLLDTDHMSFLQRRSGLEFANLSSRLRQYSPDDFALSIVSFHEQVLGAHTFINRAQSQTKVIRGYILLTETLQGFSTAVVLPFEASEIAVFEQLQTQKIRVSTMDLRIAATALSRDLIVLTRNTRDFNRVPGLSVEDWTI